MAYEIRENRTYNSREIYFDGKPSQEVREALKGLKCRWNPKKGCWYGFATEHAMVSAINGADEDVVTDGYMGGGAYYGANSGQHLYGSDLSKAIREAIKRAGIKGVTVKCDSYSMGQHIYATMKTTAEDFIGKDEYIAQYDINQCYHWIYTGEESISKDAWYDMDGDKQQEVLRKTAAYSYDRALQGFDINNYHIDSYKEFAPHFAEKVQAVNNIIQSFRYDNSNSMVDYFDTNFYYTIRTKAVLEA